MKILCVPMDTGACAFYRVTEPARAARSIGVDVQILAQIKVYGATTDDGSEIVQDVLHEADVMVIQRPLAQNVYAVAAQAKRQGIRIVVEMDDDLHAVHKRNTVQRFIDPKNQPLHNWEWAAKTIALADLLIVSTPALTRYGPEKAVVVRNRLPERILPLAPESSPARGVVGWTGTVSVHPEDLQSTEGGLSRVDAPFRVVGVSAGVAAALRLPPSRVTLGAEWDNDIPTYWARVADQIGVGVAPLQDSAFNRAKSALKCQEYMALGIPYVASPLPEYRWLTAESDAGVIASARGQWGRAVNRLLRDDDEYQRRRQAGLEWSREHTMENHVHEWVAAWARAADPVRKGVTVIA